MPDESERVTLLPDGLVPLLNQRQLEEYYGVSNWLVNQWIQRGMPTEPMRTAGRKRQRRFDIDRVRSWMASVA